MRTSKVVSLRAAERAVHGAFDNVDVLVDTLTRCLLVSVDDPETLAALESRLREMAENVRANRAMVVSKLRRGELG